MSRRDNHPGQLGFDALLAQAERDNLNREEAQECAHLPGAMDEAVPFLRKLIERHHAAMLKGDAVAVMAMREEAHRLATKLNNFKAGIFASPDAPGCVLDRLTKAPCGQTPLWGQTGDFEITVARMRVRVEMNGLLGVAANVYHWLGFAAHAVDYDKPFLSETGFRSFITIGGDLEPGVTCERLAADVIASHITDELKGRLRKIEPRYRHLALGRLRRQ